MIWVQAKADAAYERLRIGNEGLETDAVEVCASRGAVAPHRDDDGTDKGMRIFGLVLRSDGHRLHSDGLCETGNDEGLLLSPGDLYEIDPFDRHWTTVPASETQAQLIFTVAIMNPDGRSAKKLAHDFLWNLIAASINEMRAKRVGST